MRRLYRFFIKTFLCLIIFLSIGILAKNDNSIRDLVRNKVYQENISFSYFKSIYNKYLGGVFPIENINSLNVQAVFDEKLKYYSIEDYHDGALLKVDKNYLVPNMEGGVVVYIGDKELYNKVVMIERDDGVDVWYGNLCNYTVNLYDHIETGTYLGEVCDDKLYLVYSKGNEFLPYQENLGY